MNLAVYDFIAWRRFVARIKYKPGVSFEMVDYNHCAALRVTMKVPDAREAEPKESRMSVVFPAEPMENIYMEPARTRKLVPVTGTLMLPKWQSAKQATLEVQKFLRDMEDHERDEWFKVDDVAIFNPHLDPDESRARFEAIKE